MSQSPLISMLHKSRDQFRLYGDNHANKTPPQVEKAQVNYALADEIDDLLEGHAKLSGNLTQSSA